MAVRCGDRFRWVAPPPVDPPGQDGADNAHSDTGTTSTSSDVGVKELRDMVASLASMDYADDDAARIDRIRLLEQLRAGVAAAQALESVEFEESQIATQRDNGVSERIVGRGVGDQIGLARKLSPTSGSRELGWMRALVKQMPHTRRLLTVGHISEATAKAMVTETEGLTREDRTRVDADLAGTLPSMSTREAQAAARKLAYALDPEAATRRARKARKDRRVTIRPAPDTMTMLSALLPVEQGVAAWASLDRYASVVKASGDKRTRSQIMADTLVERITGQSKATDVDVEVRITVTPDTLADDDDGPGDVDGFGPAPADIVRDILGFAGTSTAGEAEETADVRGTGRVFVRPVGLEPEGDTVDAVGARRRRFTAADARLIRARDQVCRTPGCGAPIRHLDHITPYRSDGPTTTENGQGLCERCSYVKETPGWSTSVLDAGTDGAPHTTVITTPTGHAYRSQAPPAIGHGPSRRVLRTTRVERRLRRLQTHGRLADLSAPTPP